MNSPLSGTAGLDGGSVESMTDTPDTGAGGDAASYEDLISQVGGIYRELERELKRRGLTARQRREERQPVEAAIPASLETTYDPSGRAGCAGGSAAGAGQMDHLIHGSCHQPRHGPSGTTELLIGDSGPCDRGEADAALAQLGDQCR